MSVLWREHSTAIVAGHTYSGLKVKGWAWWLQAPCGAGAVSVCGSLLTSCCELSATIVSTAGGSKAAGLREYPKKQISKEVTAYNQVFYPESRSLLRRYSRDNAPSGAFRLPTGSSILC